MAKDPLLISWIEGYEQNEELGKMALDKIAGIARDYDYNNTFIVSAITLLGRKWRIN